MSGNNNILDDRSRLILHRTAREDIKKGITVMDKGEGVRLVDKEGKRYLDMEAGITRPVHVGYGRQEIARAAYDLSLIHISEPTRPFTLSRMPSSA